MSVSLQHTQRQRLTSEDMAGLEAFMREQCADLWETAAISHARDVLARQG